MPLFERHEPQFERLLALLRVPGNGPLLLRIGGDSADQAAFGLRVPRLPRAILELTPTGSGRRAPSCAPLERN